MATLDYTIPLNTITPMLNQQSAMRAEKRIEAQSMTKGFESIMGGIKQRRIAGLIPQYQSVDPETGSVKFDETGYVEAVRGIDPTAASTIEDAIINKRQKRMATKEAEQRVMDGAQKIASKQVETYIQGLDYLTSQLDEVASNYYLEKKPELAKSMYDYLKVVAGKLDYLDASGKRVSGIDLSNDYNPEQHLQIRSLRESMLSAYNVLNKPGGAGSVGSKESVFQQKLAAVKKAHPELTDADHIRIATSATGFYNDQPSHADAQAALSKAKKLAEYDVAITQAKANQDVTLERALREEKAKTALVVSESTEKGRRTGVAGSPDEVYRRKTAKIKRDKLLLALDELESEPNLGNGISVKRIWGAVPGTKEYGAKALLEQVKAMLDLDAAKDMKGQGAITETERTTLAKSATRLTQNLSREDFVEEIRTVRYLVRKMALADEESYAPVSGEPTSPEPTSGGIDLPDDYEFK